MSDIDREFIDSREAFTDEAQAWAEYEAYVDGEHSTGTNFELSEAWHDQYYGDGQPDEAQE